MLHTAGAAEIECKRERVEGLRGGVTVGSVPMRMVWGLPLKKERAHGGFPEEGRCELEQQFLLRR